MPEPVEQYSARDLERMIVGDNESMAEFIRQQQQSRLGVLAMEQVSRQSFVDQRSQATLWSVVADLARWLVSRG